MKIRIDYSKTERLVYTSTLDIQKLWERSFRRAKLNLQYSQGFHPQPRIQIANPLPLGFAGLHELVDIKLIDEITIEQIQDSLANQFPIGLNINSILILPEHSPSLPKQVVFSEYIVRLHDNTCDFDELSNKCANLLLKTSIDRVRNRKPYDLRPLIKELSISQSSERTIKIALRMDSSPGKTGRPEEVMYELGFELEDFQVTRTQLILNGPSS